MKLSMLADFRILKDYDGDGVFLSLSETEAKDVSIGGFQFVVGDKNVPFDWEQHVGTENNGIFSFVTGVAFGHGTYELDNDCFEEDYAQLGIRREAISAEFLASAHHIEEFYINFEDGAKEVSLGHYTQNADEKSKYKLELIEISFEDIETGRYYDVSPEVIAAFNKGERVIVVSQEEMDRMAQHGEKRLFNQTKEDMADLDSRISICEAIAKDPTGSSVPNIKRDER